MARLEDHTHLALGCAHVPRGWAIDQRDMLLLPLAQRPLCAQQILAVFTVWQDQLETYRAENGVTRLTVQTHPTLPSVTPLEGDPFTPVTVGIAFVCLVQLPDHDPLVRTFRLHIDVVEPRLIYAAIERLVLAHDLLWYTYLKEYGPPPGSETTRCDCIRPLLDRYPALRLSVRADED